MDWLQALLYVGIFAVVALLVVLGSKWHKERKDAQETLEFMSNMLEVTTYILNKLGLDDKFSIATIINYISRAIDVVEDAIGLEETEDKAKLIKDTTLQICKDNKIEVDDKLVSVVDIIVGFFFTDNPEVK